jgi:folate-binding protein YgfZ
MDETNLPPECGIESRAVVYDKGCYIGQEVINRIHSIGHVNRQLRGLRLAAELAVLPQTRDKLYRDEKEIGYLTSVVKSPRLGNIALGYLRREANQPGTEVIVRAAAGENNARVEALPFV